MKRTTLVALCAATLAVSFASLASASGITAGNLIVTQFGDGSASLSGTSAALILKEFTTAGAATGNTIALPTAAGSGSTPNPLTVSGSATSEGAITLSTNGQYLTVVGYAAAPGLTSVTTTTVSGSAVPRVVGRITVATGAIDTTTALTDAYQGSNIRSAVSTDGTNIWLGGNAGSGLGATSGVRYTTLGSSTSTQLNATGGNMRNVNINGTTLYVSSGSSPFIGVNMVGSPPPTTSGQTLTLIAADAIGTSPSPYDYYFADANTLYVADDRSTSTLNTGGLQKYTFNGTSWTLAYTLVNGLTAGLRGLAGTTDGSGNAILYATTTDSLTKLVSITDSISAGSLPGAEAFTTLTTAAANTAYRGVELIPVPEPASIILGGLGLAVMFGIYRRRSS